MNLLYLQQLLVLPEMPGNARSWEFVRNWKAQGVEVRLLTSSAYLKNHPEFPSNPSYPFLWKHEDIDIWVVKGRYDHHMPFGQRVISFLLFFLRAWRLRKKLSKPDAVLAYTAPLSVAELGKRLSAYWSVPFYLEVADVWPEVPIGMGIIRDKRIIHWLRKRTQKIYEATTHIFTFSPDMRDWVIKDHPASQKVTTVFNGTAHHLLEKVTSTSKIASSDPVRILYTGTLGVANDVSQVIHALHLLEKRGHTHLKLDIVGEGNDGAKVKALAHDLGLEIVTFHKQLPKARLEEFWAQADIGIISFAPYPILESNAATKFFDYLAAGLPIVINYEGWQAEYLQRFNCGMASRQGDIEAFARNILFLSRNRHLRKRMGANGQRLARERFDREKLSRKMLLLMDKATVY